MKKLSLLIILALFAQSTVIAQPCLPDGIVFSSQAEIDNFQTNHPDCTEIEGDVEINGDNITNLTGLSMVTSIGGDLRINDNDALTNLTGLDNLTSIGGELKIQANDTLTSLTGLDNLTSIGGVLAILWNDTLTTLTALENLTSIGGLAIWNSNALTSLAGLEGLTSIGGRFYFVGNDAITNLVGLDNVTSIGGELFIHSNDTLTNLTGLDNLSFINGNLELGVYNASAGGIFGNPSLTSLAALSNLDSIAGGLAIYADTSLLDLTGLDGLTSLVFLTVHGNNALTSLTGLEGLTSIGGRLSFDNNDALTNLTGLDNLTSIGGGLIIGSTFHSYVGNPALTSLTGLDNVSSIGGSLFIYGNNALTSLTGLNSIAANSITDLTIINNDSLSTCEVQSICDYLESPSGDIEIHDNATGCNDQQEVEAACETVSVEEVRNSDKFLIYPNPSTTQITIELPSTPQKNAILTIYNTNSQQLLSQRITDQTTVVDVSGLLSGFYYVKVFDNRTMMVGKMIKN